MPVLSIAQLQIDSISKKAEYTGIVQVAGVSKEELYTRARSWFVKTYKDADVVIQMDDKDAGKIIGKGRFGVIWQMGVEWWLVIGVT